MERRVQRPKASQKSIKLNDQNLLLRKGRGEMEGQADGLTEGGQGR